MQKDILNKSMQAPPVSKSQVRRLEEQTGEELPLQEWQFSGDGRKRPTTIKAKSRDEAMKKYGEYLKS